MDELVYGESGLIPVDTLTPEERDEVEFSDNILKDKRSHQGEIIVTLFESCNLSCKFCSQNHDDVTGMDTVRNKAEDIKKAITTLRRMGRKMFGVHVMGGELFQDSIPDHMFDDYHFLIQDVWEFAQAEGVEIDFAFVSNLVHDRTDRVIKLIQGLKDQGVVIGLMTSYDPASRFNKAALDKFKANIDVYESIIHVVNVVMTAPNIRKFLNRQTPLFDKLYEKFDIYFDYYTPEKSAMMNAPADHELRDMMKFLVDNYPRVMPIRGYIAHEVNRMHCQNTYNIMPNGNTGHCILLLGGNYQARATRTAGQMESKFIKDYDCLSCEYFYRCGLGCFQQHFLMSEKRTLPGCWLKQVYDHIGDANDERTGPA